MAVVKTYSIKVHGYEHTFPVYVGQSKKKKYITFTNPRRDDSEGYLHTDDKELQEAIEDSPKFKNNEVKLISKSGEDKSVAVKGVKKKSVKTDEPVEYKDVENINDAIEILKGLGVDEAKIINPEDILTIAEEKNVSFPNLSFE